MKKRTLRYYWEETKECLFIYSELIIPILMALFAAGIMTLLIVSHTNPYHAFWIYPILFFVWFILSFGMMECRCCGW